MTNESLKNYVLALADGDELLSESARLAVPAELEDPDVLTEALHGNASAHLANSLTADVEFALCGSSQPTMCPTPRPPASVTFAAGIAARRCCLFVREARSTDLSLHLALRRLFTRGSVRGLIYRQLSSNHDHLGGVRIRCQRMREIRDGSGHRRA
jgi:hypothetical protein